MNQTLPEKSNGRSAASCSMLVSPQNYYGEVPASVFTISLLAHATYRANLSCSLLKPLLSIYILFLVGSPLALAGMNTLPQPDIHDKTVATTNSSCRQNDSLALVALYNATNGPTWTNTWDLSQPMESWFGVILDTEGCVQEIDLNYNGLTGEIPVGLMAVSNLQTLNLSFNTSLTGEIPTEIGQLAFLETLNFARTGLSGSIPLEIWNLTNLRNLNLSSTWVGGNIPPEIGNLTELETLNLSSVYAVGGNFNGELPLELVVCQVLIYGLSGSEF
ncbi:MAG: hypothetical protein ACE362_15125 [Phaeodactylibacter xiamenensis]|uniref:leucine-rich repeat domain-containing protein n=1 Tax=Phaeodactylibacter xiamenensis TaxID=1524460 RepID=UPI001269B135|nr:hypothetical protein [Phaeodactylibacter xiamenensis]MCR9053085.1 hypothetical protein [bacterium]